MSRMKSTDEGHRWDSASRWSIICIILEVIVAVFLFDYYEDELVSIKRVVLPIVILVVIPLLCVIGFLINRRLFKRKQQALEISLQEERDQSGLLEYVDSVAPIPNIDSSLSDDEGLERRRKAYLTRIRAAFGYYERKLGRPLGSDDREHVEDLMGYSEAQFDPRYSEFASQLGESVINMLAGNDEDEEDEEEKVTDEERLDRELKEKEQDLKLARLDKQIEQEHVEKESLRVPMAQPSEDDRFQEECERIKKELLQENLVKSIRVKIQRDFEDDKLALVMASFDKLLNAQSRKIADINNRNFSEAEGKEALRTGQQVFIKQLDDFEKTI